ncbi:hypothetical protein BGZ49_003710 [Haplosporangium sp. Z 27]|nr:hypothetical protein BGZ49_003710 [Haplosporangium sp. Z 27]
MKFTTVVAAASMAALAHAQTLGIHDPTTQTTWVSGGLGYLSWTGTCAIMGNASHAVKVQLVNGPSNAVAFVAELGTIDCSSTTNVSAYITVPGPAENVQPGPYSIQILTLPNTSYSSAFTIAANSSSNPTTSAVASATSAPAAATTTATTKSSANSLIAGSLVAALGTAVAAVQFFL